MPNQPKPDHEVWYHFDNIEEFFEWVASLPEYDPNPHRVKCRPMRIRHFPICRGGCPGKEHCYTEIVGMGEKFKVRCHCK